MIDKTIDRKRVIQTFAEYVANYNEKNPKIKLKIDHTYRVASLCERIAGSIAGEESFTEHDIDLAWTIGMLHDVGRFEQVTRYGTFVDAQSVSHAELGADILFKEGLIKSFFPEPPEDKDVDLMEICIRNHSLYRISEDITPREKVFCNILRDADKVDIFCVNWETPMEEIYNVSTEDLKTASVTEEVKQAFMERHAVLRSLKKTSIDNLVGHICLYFELVYEESRRQARNQGYLDKLMSFTSENEETNQWFEYMRNHL